ncbi:CPXCG motif-containing cysteine-rich protein [Azotobacter chroococcum]|uniref:CPXCG motif-containing cysteine-rich protein n=1 Tax=Azotobacter chroococcum TaxID=353 RepID=A0AA44C7H1_9GAMM|nr:CPXCG motif-containing cysteine-rich protein [Azotobacter chroococcum]NHN76762.1 CPXCG motif-containing cysteine-rich protein [Azotobacter chroococcum]
MLEMQSYQCPCRGETVEALLDLSAGDQQYIEDCPVCCCPLLFELHTDGIDWTLAVRREDD